MAKSQPDAMANPMAFIEETIRQLESEKLALGQKVENLGKSLEHQFDLVHKISYQNEKIKSENARLKQLYKDYDEQQEKLESDLATRENKVRFLDHAAVKNGSSVANLAMKMKDVKAWTEMCQKTVAELSAFEEATVQKNFDLKRRVESLEQTEKHLQIQFQSLSSSEKILESELAEGTRELEAEISSQRQLKEEIDEMERRAVELEASNTERGLEMREVKNQCEVKIQGKLKLEEDIRNKDAQIRALISNKEQLLEEKKAVLSEKDTLIKVKAVRQHEVHDLENDVEALRQNLMELRAESEAQKDEIISVTAINEKLETTEESLKLQCNNLQQGQIELEEDIKQSQNNLNSATLSNMNLAVDVAVHKDQLVSLAVNEERLTEENFALNFKIANAEEIHGKEIELLRSEMQFREQAEYFLTNSLESLQKDLNELDIQIENQAKAKEAQDLAKKSLKTDIILFQEKNEDLSKEVQLLQDGESESLQEIQRKSNEVELLASAVETLSLNNEVAKNELDTAATTIFQLNLEVQLSKEESENLRSNFQKVQEDLEETVLQIKTLSEKLDSQRQLLEDLVSMEGELQGENSDLKNQLLEMQLKVAVLEQTLYESLKRTQDLEDELQNSSATSVQYASRHAELSEKFQSLLKISDEKEEAHVADISELRSAMNSADVNSKMDLDRYRKELGDTRVGNQKLHEELELAKNEVSRAENFNKTQEEELVRFAQEIKRLTQLRADVKSQSETLNASLIEKQSQLEKARQDQLRLISAKEQKEHQLTKYMAKNQEQVQTITELRQDINDMAFSFPAPANPSTRSNRALESGVTSAKPLLNTPKKFDSKKQESLKKKTLDLKNVYTPRKEQGTKPSKMISPIKPPPGVKPAPNYLDSTFDLSLNLSSDEDMPPSKDSGIKGNQAAGNSSKPEQPKTKKFFRARRV